MAELVSGEEGIEKMRAALVGGLRVGMRGSWAYRKQGAWRILVDGSLFLRMALLSSPPALPVDCGEVYSFSIKCAYFSHNCVHVPQK